MSVNANITANVHATGEHRDTQTFQRLKHLIADHPPPCVSLYLPTYRSFPDSQQNLIKYRNALRELKAKLESTRYSDLSAEILDPFERVLDDRDFWSHPRDGIAIFGAPRFFHVEKVQRPVPEAVVVNNHLYIKPLVRIFQSDDSYQILALDRKSIKLYQGNRSVLDEVVMSPSVPRTVEEALGPNVTQQGIERMGAQGVHGHGSKKDETGVDIERFFRVVDRAIHDAHSKPSELPLILAALPEYHTHFRAVSHNSFLLDEGINGNADAMSLDALRQEAWKLMGPRYHQRLQQIIDMYHAAKARTLATDDLTHAVEFADDGRIGTLLIEAVQRIPGHIEGGMPRYAAVSDAQAGDILDDLAERVLKTGGQVIVAPRASMPSGTGLAAIFRY